MKTTIMLFVISLVTVPALATLPGGDFNGDGSIDCLDVDALVAEIAAGTNDSQYDITGDGLVDVSDLDEWLALAGAANLPSGEPYARGDANLDGAVDGADFIIMNANFGLTLVGYCGGDFNADGFVSITDLTIFCANAPPNFCDGVVATELSSWGAAKTLYR